VNNILNWRIWKRMKMKMRIRTVEEFTIAVFAATFAEIARCEARKRPA